MPNCINWGLLINGKTGISKKGDKMGGFQIIRGGGGGGGGCPKMDQKCTFSTIFLISVITF